MIDPTKEYILCAAIHYDDGKYYSHQPNGITTGFVISGYTHSAIIESIAIPFGRRITHKDEQGFLTSTGKFVDRGDALDIAINNGQTTKSSGELYSEDLYRRR